MMIVANNRPVQEGESEPKRVLTKNRDSSVAYIQLSESSYCRHNNYSVAFAVRERWPEAGTPQRIGIDKNWKEPYGDRMNEVVFIGQNMDRTAIELAWKNAHLNFTETRKGMKGWAALPDPFPAWERIAAEVEAR